MLKRSLCVAASMVLILLSFCACSGFSLKSADSLMRPPLVSGVDSELKNAFEEAVNGKTKTASPARITLVPPSSGDYRSAFVLHDIDGDGENEALVFYSLDYEPSRGHMNVLDYKNGSWISIADFSASGSSINFVRFVQMNFIGCPAILVSQSIYENDTSKILSVYTCDNSSEKLVVENVCTEVYSVMENADVDSDGRLDIFIIQQDFSNATSPQSLAKALRMSDEGKIEEIGSAKLDGGISSYISVQTEKVNPASALRIYVDASKGETQMITEVIYWNSVSNSLRAPMFDVDTQSNILTRREEPLKAQDFDGDGIIEIPSQEALGGSRRYMSPKTLYQQMYITSWIEIKTDSELDYKATVVNAADSYLVYADEIRRITGEFTIYAYDSSKTWIFREYNSSLESVGDELFALVSTTQLQAEEDGVDKSLYLLENNNMVVYFEPRSKGTAEGLTADSIKDYVKTFKG